MRHCIVSVEPWTSISSGRSSPSARAGRFTRAAPAPRHDAAQPLAARAAARGAGGREARRTHAGGRRPHERGRAVPRPRRARARLGRRGAHGASRSSRATLAAWSRSEASRPSAPTSCRRCSPASTRTARSVVLRLREGLADQIEERARLRRARSGAHEPAGAPLDLAAQKLWQEDYLLAVPAGHRLASLDRPVALAEAASEPLVVVRGRDRHGRALRGVRGAGRAPARRGRCRQPRGGAAHGRARSRRRAAAADDGRGGARTDGCAPSRLREAACAARSRSSTAARPTSPPRRAPCGLPSWRPSRPRRAKAR